MNTEGENLIFPQPISVRWKLIGTFSGSCIEMMGTDDSESIQLVEQIQSAVSGKYLVA